MRLTSATRASHPRPKRANVGCGTYRAYERGPDSAKYIQLDHHRARDFAARFGVRRDWLLFGEGEPWLTPHNEVEPDEAQGANPVRAWREYRGLSRADLAERAGTTPAVLAQLEAGELELSDKWRLRLATALGTQAGFLHLDPNVCDPDLLNAALDVPKERREQALQILRTFKSGAR
ncbi:MAG: helix-turn-helix domain-containing protein [Caulobacterales bacterium]